MKLKIRGLVFAGFAAAVFAQSASAVETADKTVTSKTYVDSKIQGTVNNATTITDNSSDTKAPSELNVYKFVSNQIVSSGGGVDGNIDYHTDKIGYLDSTWAAANTNLESPYMVTKAQLAANPTWADHVVKWELIVPDSVVAETAGKIGDAGDAGATAAEQAKFPTAKAVYDFVTNGDPNDPNFDGFQPKITDNLASSALNINSGEDAGVGVMVGYKGYSNGEFGNSTWLTFAAAANHTDSLGYLNITEDATDSKHKYLVDIKGNAIAKTAQAISTGGQASGADAYLTRDKLTTAKAVYDYAVKQNWTQANAGKTLVVGSDGIVTVSTNANPDIPGVDDMPEVCTTAAGGHVCALVAYYDTQSSGVVYEWTVMAPTGSGS